MIQFIFKNLINAAKFFGKRGRGGNSFPLQPLSFPPRPSGLGFCETPQAFLSKKVRAFSIIAHQSLFTAWFASLGASPLGIGFRQKIPGDFEFRQKHSRRKSAVRADRNKKIPHGWEIFLFREIFGLVGFNNPVSREFEPMIAFSLKVRQFLLNRFLSRH